MSFVLYFISRHPGAQRQLRVELQSAAESFKEIDGKASSLPSPQTLESLPFLNAVLKESIRLQGNVPTSNPRLTNSHNARLGPYENSPPGTGVSAFAWFLHRSA